MFDTDPYRGTDLTVTVGDFYVDYSTHCVTLEALGLLLDLARDAGVEKRRDAMFAGEHINTSEDRAVSHTPLRHRRDATLTETDRTSSATSTMFLDRMRAFTDRIRSGDWRGATGETITTVVNIGIGGSDLGPAMVYRASRHYTDGPEVRFVSNVDPADLVSTLCGLDPASTPLFERPHLVLGLPAATDRVSAGRHANAPPHTPDGSLL